MEIDGARPAGGTGPQRTRASNFGLLGIGVSTVGMVGPAPPAALGSDAETRHWGVFHRATMPSGLVVFVSVLVMGLGKDLQP